MSWPDPARRFEPAEDVQLRAELRDLLGLHLEQPVTTVGDTAEMADLAEKLLREAERRRRAYPFRPRATWKLAAAAALPILLGMGALGFWGNQQRQRADALAQRVQQKEEELQRVAMESRASQEELGRERAAKEDVQRQLVQVAQKLNARSPYLVIPAKRPSVPEEVQTLRVKNPE